MDEITRFPAARLFKDGRIITIPQWTNKGRLPLFYALPIEIVSKQKEYLDDPMRKGYWIIDPETAPIVKKIFDLTMDGNGATRIAGILEREQIETPTTVYNRRHGKPLPPHPCHWEDGTTTGILDRIEYTGCTCNFKTYSKSYKLKKRIRNKPEDMYIVENTQEAIIPKAQWDRVQELRKERHRTPKKADRRGLFSSIIFCADCGRRMHFCTCKSFDGSQDHYKCSLYKSGYGECSAHFIREEDLRDIGSPPRLSYLNYNSLLLCETAKNEKIPELYDNIAIDNPGINLFLQCGFHEEYRTEKIIMLKKQLL